MCHGVVVETVYGERHDRPNVIKYFKLHVNKAFYKDPIVTYAMVSRTRRASPVDNISCTD